MLKKITKLSILLAMAHSSYAIVGNVGGSAVANDDLSSIINQLPAEIVSEYQKRLEQVKGKDKERYIRALRANYLTVNSAIIPASSRDFGVHPDLANGISGSTVYFNIPSEVEDPVNKYVQTIVTGKHWGTEVPNERVTKVRVFAKFNGKGAYNQPIDLVMRRSIGGCEGVEINAAVLCATGYYSYLTVSLADTKSNYNLANGTYATSFNVHGKGWHNPNIEEIIPVNVNWKKDSNSFGKLDKEYQLTEMGDLLTDNYFQTTPKSSNVSFLIPEYSNAAGHQFPVWGGKASEWSKINVPVTAVSTGQKYNLELEAVRPTGCGNYVMNSGGGCGSTDGSLRLRVAESNKAKLPKDKFVGNFIVAAEGWHDAFKKQLKINVDWQNGNSNMPIYETINLNKLEENIYTKKYKRDITGSDTGVWFGVAPWTSAIMDGSSIGYWGWWYNGIGYTSTKITVDVRNLTDGSTHQVEITGIKPSSCGNYPIQSGGGCYSDERQIVLKLNNSNQVLPSGHYIGSFDLLVNGWNDAQFKQRINVEINWQHGTLPKTVELEKAVNN